jgi:type VI secretion system protein ImpE
MEIKELIQTGQLGEARRQLVAAVKASPRDPASRTLLFQVLCYCGEWAKADRHLEAIAALDGSREAGSLGYRNLVRAEMERSEILEHNTPASFISEAPGYLDLFLQLRKKLQEERESEAKELLDQLAAQLPMVSGTVNELPFAGCTDTDTTLFPFLEVFAHERYLWLPFESIRELSVSRPQSLLDLLWIAARITTWEGITMNCFLPVLYPNSFLHGDARVKMGRMTDWQPLAGSYARGMGQHVLAIGGRDMALLEIQDIIFNFPGKEERDEKRT